MKYHELNDEAKEKAREWMRSNVGEDFDGEVVVNDWKTLLGFLGFTGIDIFWSGFWSQGDGACFRAEWSIDWMELDKVPDHTSHERAKGILVYFSIVLGLYKLMEAADIDYDADPDYENPVVVGAKLTHIDFGRYYHENSIDFSFDTGAPYPSNEAQEEFKDWCKDLMRMIHKDLEAEYEYQTGDEYVVEAIEANEYDFNDQGEIA